MNEIHKIISSYLAGKEIYPPLRRLLNFFLLLTITSFFYEKNYGSYLWYNYNDYKKILDFVVKGEVYIPIVIFLIVLVTTETLSSALFVSLSSATKHKSQKAIIDFDILRNKAKENGTLSDMLYKLLRDLIIDSLEKDKFKKESNPLYYKRQDALRKQQTLLTENFTLATRAITVLIILINTVPNFKLGLFIILLGLMLLWMIILIKSHQFIARLDEELGNKEQLISEATEIQMIAASKNNS